MSSNEAEIIRIFRLLTPELQADLLDLVRRAYREENYTQKLTGCSTVADSTLAMKSQENSYENIKKLIKQRVKE